MHAFDDRTEIVYDAICRRILYQGAENGLRCEVPNWPDDQSDSEWLGSRAKQRDGLRMAIVGDKKVPPPLIVCAMVIASAAAVDSSSSDAFEISIPVKSQTMVWKFRRASRRSCALSA